MKPFTGIYKKIIAMLLVAFVSTSGALASSSPSWDIDGNGEVDALTDALLLLRYTFGLRGDNLANGAVATNSPLSASEIEDSIASALVIADIDADGEVDALTDALLLLRYTFGLRDSNLIDGAVATNAPRNSSAAIENYIQRHMVDYVPTTYNFTNSTYVADSDSVSYTGQVARQLLITGMVDYMEAMTESGKSESEYLLDLDFYMNGDGADDAATGFTLKNGAVDGSDVLNAITYGDISSGKNLDGKIAGGNGEGGGETSKLITDFFGWEGFEGALPIDLVDSWTAQLAAQATDGVSLTIPTVDGDVNVASVQYDAAGRNYRQLLQKFLMGAVSFSQGTNDYFQSDWTVQVATQEGTKNYTEAEHNFDEAFGYYGAARNNNDYTDLEARAKSGRDEWKNGYHDTNSDGLIDPRSEFNFGHSQNCAKRDVGSAGNSNPTDLSGDAMNAFLAGRHIIANASTAGFISDDELAALQTHIKTAAVTWEKCIAATAIHYINDVTADIAGFSNGSYASVSNFTDLGKHWSELKGFALSLQFSPFSPFHDADVTAVNIDDLKAVLSAIGDAPVLATDTQATIDAYTQALALARDTLQQAYSFDAENVAGW
jgi:hypothetical protein